MELGGAVLLVEIGAVLGGEAPALLVQSGEVLAKSGASVVLVGLVCRCCKDRMIVRRPEASPLRKACGRNVAVDVGRATRGASNSDRARVRA